MSVANLPPIQTRAAPAVPEIAIFRLSVDQYHDMIRTGILTEEDPTELLEGWLVSKMSKNPPHSVGIDLVASALRNLASPNWYVRIQDPITTADSEPEPDISLARGGSRDYVDRNPRPADLALVVEIADSSLEQNRKTKLRIYARAGIPIYWIVNLLQRQVEIYTQPRVIGANASYAQQQNISANESIPLIIEGREIGRIPVADILP